MRIATLLAVAGLVVLSTLGWFTPVSAQWPSDPEVNLPICTAEGPQAPYGIATDGAEGAIVVWVDSAGGRYSVFAQKVNSAGFTSWGHNGIKVCEETSDQMQPGLVADGSGGVIVAWADSRDGFWSIYAQRVDASGSPLWHPAGIPICADTTAGCYHRTTTDGSKGAIITWFERTDGPGIFDIRAQRVDGAGLIQWPLEGTVVCSSAGEQIYPKIVSDGLGGAIMVWQDHREGRHDIYAQRVDESGNAQWAPDGVRVSATVPGFLSRAAPDGLGGVAICWETGMGEVYAQSIDSSGVAQWTLDGISINGGLMGHGNDSRIASDASGGAIICWEQRVFNPPVSDIYAQRVDASGSPCWGPNGVPVCTAAFFRTQVQAGPDGFGGAIVAWCDSRHSDLDIYAQRVDSSGVTQWTPGGVAVSLASGAQHEPQLLPLNSCGAIVAWTDGRIDYWNPDIYAQRVSCDGSLGVPPVMLVTGGGWLAEHAESENTKRTFGFNAHSELGVVWGQLQFNDHAANQKIHSDTVVGLSVHGDTCAEFSGTCRVGRHDGYAFDCAIEDRGEPGHGRDKFSLDVRDSDGNLYYSASGVLEGGNIQIHTAEDEISANLGEAPKGTRSPELGQGSSIQVADAVRHSRFSPAQNSPNPFHHSTRISYSLSAATHVTLTIYDITGRLIETLLDEHQQPGMHQVRWNRKGNPSGVYFYHLRTGDFICVKKMILLR